MNQQHAQTIQALHLELMQTLALTHAEHEKLAARLASDPGDFDVLDLVEKALVKMESTKRRIALFESAAAVRDANDSAASRLAVAVASRDEAVKLAARRITVAKSIDKAMATFCELMEEYAGLNDQIASASSKALRHAQDKPHLDDVQRIAAAARSLLNDPIMSALHRAGIDRLAPGSVNLVGRAGTESVKDVAAKSSDRLASMLDAALRSCSPHAERVNSEI